MIEWFAKNPVAANLLMFGIIFAGLMMASRSIPMETFPSQESDSVSISTAYRGATAKSVEQGITLRIEEAIADLEGIEEISSRSAEGLSSVNVKIAKSYGVRNLLDDIKMRVDALNSLPSDAEKPIIAISTWNPAVISVIVQRDPDNPRVNDKVLREVVSDFRDGLLTNNEISNVELTGVANYEIAIEIPPHTLDEYNISLQQVAQTIRLDASDIPAGTVQTAEGDILIRSDGQAFSAEEFAAIPILSNGLGKPVLLGDIASITDGFEEKSLITTFNNKPAVQLQVNRVGKQSAIEVAKQTRAYIEEYQAKLPEGVSLSYWDDDSEYLKTRINAVLDSALMGGILVMILLSLFLRPAVAFWVFLGIPVSFMGAFLFMPYADGTFNVISLFAFIMVIGIVVDDAIVTGENIYHKIREGEPPMQAAIAGTQEIAVPVTFGILTTVVAFLPLSFLDGTMFEFVAEQMPMVVIPVLLMSLVESKLVLPAHMSHIKPRRDDQLGPISRFQQKISYSLESFVEKYYSPLLEKCVKNQALTLILLVSFSIITLAYAVTGHIRFTPFPRVESEKVRITLVMPETTGFETTHQHILNITEHFKTLQKKYLDPETGESVIQNILAKSGSSGRTANPNLGSMRVALQPLEDRAEDISTGQIAREVRGLIGDIPGAQSLSIQSIAFRSDAPINVELSGDSPEHMYQAILKIKQQLKSYPGIFDIQDNYSGGKEELKLQLKPRAYALGLRLDDVARQVRNAMFGFQAQRIQRGRDELRVMVRYPLEHRSSLVDLYRLPIRVANGKQDVLLSEVAEIIPHESPSALYRLNRRSVLNVTADIDKDIASSVLVLENLDQYLKELKHDFPNIDYRYDGEAEDTAKASNRLQVGLIVVLIAIYALLAIPFKSYTQPLIVMLIIPFSLVGAVLGHILTFQNLSILSIFGMLALVGVVVNDSLVLVDYINQQRAKGMELTKAVLSAGARRFRPVLLTSLTTFVGLVPILIDGSQQAKWLKPMATSLAFGIIFATIITLLITPVNYLVAHTLKRNFKHGLKQLKQQWSLFFNKQSSSSG